MGSLDLRLSRALIFSNISTGTGSALRRCHPEGIWCEAAYRMMVCNIVLAVGWKSSFTQFVLYLYNIGSSLSSLER